MTRNEMAVGLLAAIVIFGIAPVVRGADAPKGPQKVVVGDGMYLFISPDPADVEVVGNAIALVNERDVLVFDANVLPSSARAVLAEIRKITDKPVRYVVNSHWHPDHWDGNEVYAREFPGVEIIANADTRRLMENTRNVYVKTLRMFAGKGNQQIEEILHSGKMPDGSALAEKDRSDLEQELLAQ